MALIAAHLNAGVILVLTVERQVYNLPLPPPPYPFPLLPVPNKPYGFCGREALCLLACILPDLWSCVKVEVAALGSGTVHTSKVRYSLEIEIEIERLVIVLAPKHLLVLLSHFALRSSLPHFQFSREQLL